MLTIWKFPLKVTDIQGVPMPQGSKLLCVQMQNGCPCLWAMVNSDSRQCVRAIRVVGTGNPIDFNPILWQYVGTVQMQGGSLVWHVFDGGEK